MVFFFGLFVVGVVWWFFCFVGNGIFGLILVGIVVLVFFFVFVGMVKYLVDLYDKLFVIVFWFLGSFVGLWWDDVRIMLVLFVVSIVGIMFFCWFLNVISFSEEEVRGFGVNVRFYRGIFIVFVVFGVLVLMVMVGMISWVGFVSFYVVWLSVGYDMRMFVLVSVFVGVFFFLVCDDVVRSVIIFEVFLGVVIVLIGVLIFIIILWRGIYVKG